MKKGYEVAPTQENIVGCMLKDAKVLAQYEKKLERNSYILGVIGLLIGDEVSKPISAVLSAILSVSKIADVQPDDIKTIIQYACSCGLVLLLVRTKYLSRNKSALSKSAEENRWFEYCELIQRHVELIGKHKLSFQKAGVDRISIYLYDNAKYFLRAGRFSYNPDYNTSGRKIYPKNEGCIGKTWETGDFFIGNLPDPTKNKKAYDQALRVMGLPKEAINGLTMRSRLYYGIRFSDGEDHSPIGVIVVESTDPNRFTANSLRTALEGELIYISNITDRARQDIPQLTEAAKVGL